MTTPGPNPPPPIPPIVALCASVGDPHMPVAIPANHPLALGTPFLGWAASGGTAPGGSALVTLSTSQMLVAFGARLSCAKSPADLPAADKVNPLTIGLSGAAWTRILNEYLGSGLLNASMASRAELITYLSSLVITTPSNLQISANDWHLGEDTAGAPGVPGVAAVPAIPPAPAVGRRGQRGHQPAVAGAPAVPAVPAIPGRPTLDPALNFLTLIHVFELESEGSCPWSVVAYLSGALGPVLTQAERNRPGSQAQFIARALAAGAHRHFGTTPGDDYSLANNLRDYLLIIAHSLPSEFLSAGVSHAALRAEFRDAIVYSRDADGRRSVEESRVFSFGASNPTLQTYILNRAAAGTEAYNLILMGIRGLLPRYDASNTPLRELVPLLEAALYSKQAVLAQAATATGATAASIMTELIRQTHVLRGASGLSASAGPSSLAAVTASAGHASDAYEEALTGAAFIQFKAAMANADLLSTAGRRAAFEAATEGDCILPIRLLLAGEATLAKRDGALGALMGLRPFLSEWLTHVAVVDAQGVVHPGLTKWCITGTGGKQTAFLDSFLKLEFHTMNWMGSHETPGLLHFLSAKHHAPIAAPHPADHYCVPMDMRALASFGQSLFSGIGYPADPTAPSPSVSPGYSWATWWNYLADVVERAATLASREAQLDWLDDVHEQAEAALLLMSRLARAEIYASENIRDRKLGALLPHDCAPAEYLRTKLREFAEDQAREARLRPFFGGRGRQPTIRASAHELPLRSTRHRKRKPELQLGKGGKGGDIGGEETAISPEGSSPHLQGGEEKVKREVRARGANLKKPFWLKPKEYLLVSGRVWSVKKLAAKLGVSADSKCWEVVLSRRTDAHRQEGCPMQGVGAAHASISASAHVVEGFDIVSHLHDFSRAPTEAELRRASSAPEPDTPRGPASRGGRGARGRGQGFPKPASA